MVEIFDDDRRFEPGHPVMDEQRELPDRPMRLQFLAMARRIGADHAIVELDPLLIKRDQHLPRSEEHTSELQSLMRISYAVFCLKKKKKKTTKPYINELKISQQVYYTYHIGCKQNI